jgi:phenylacetate-CoA ligase
MLKIRGVMVFPSQIERAILKIDGLTPNYQIIVTRDEYLDVLEIKVETSPKLFFDDIKSMEELEKRIENNIHKEIGLKTNITLVEPDTLPRSEGKAIRVIDKRNFD